MNVNEVRRLENMNARPGGDAFPQPKPEPKKKSRQLLDQSFDVNTRLNTIRTYEPAIQKATQKVLEFERDSIKAALGRSDIHLETWLQEFYQTEVPSLLKATFAPTFREFLEAIQGAVEDEIGAVTGDLTGDLDRITDRCAQSHVYASQALLSKHERTEDIEAETDGWTETRAAKIAGLEVTRGANKVAQAVYQSNGYQYNRWNIVGEKTCPWCEALAGRIFPIGAPFVEAGNFDVEGQVMAVKSTPTPPLHAGCDCYLSPA